MKSKKKKGMKKHEEEPLFESDEYFAVIIGYTSGGAPYGVTWEEYEKMEPCSNVDLDIDDEDLPF